jgi:membrane-anchored protein YejM (alkaline phosphatase superfamily)
MGRLAYRILNTVAIVLETRVLNFLTYHSPQFRRLYCINLGNIVHFSLCPVAIRMLILFVLEECSERN